MNKKDKKNHNSLPRIIPKASSRKPGIMELKIKTEKSSIFHNGNIRGLQLPGFITGALILLITFNFLAIFNIFIPKEELKIGSVSDKTVKSPKTVYFKSLSKTKEAQEKAAEKVEKVYKFDLSITVQQKSKAEEAFRKIDEILDKPNEENTSLISSVLGLNLSDDSANYISGLSKENWQILKTETLAVLSDLQKSEKIKNDEKISGELIENKISKNISDKDRQIIKELVNTLLIPNYIFSKEDTDKKTEEAKADVEPVSLLVTKDEVIINAGKIIDELDLEKLEAVGLRKAIFLNPKTIGMIVISTILSLLVLLYFKYFYISSISKPVTSNKALFIFIIFFSLTVFAFQVLTPLKPIMAYIIPVAASAILIAILVSIEAAVFSAIVFSVFLGIISSNSLELASIYLITSLIGIYTIKSATKLESFFRVGFYLALFNFLVSISFHLIAGSFSIRTISVLLGAAAIYGLGAVVLIIGTLLFWGHVFKITTILELLELENPNQSLLKDLSLKAPGTYHHSILVSNLAGKAASDIRANALLLRVGALYHDIGKIPNASYFIENQKRFNIHDKLKNPERSAEIIKAHIRDGIELAKKEKLPKEIMHFIESHHGTSEVFYFLSKAKEEKLKVDLSKFFYEGPLPQTKEAAILMLADSIEAKTRATSENLSVKYIKELVSEIIDFKFGKNQLSESDLSLKEINIIKKSFIDTLMTMYHRRIKYPDEKK